MTEIENNLQEIFFKQLKGTALRFTRLAKESAVFIQLTLMVKVPLMCSVTKQKLEGDGLCSKRDWTARLISTAAGMTTSGGLVT